MIYYRSLYLKANLNISQRGKLNFSLLIFTPLIQWASSYLSTYAQDFLSLNYASDSTLLATSTNPPFLSNLGSSTTSFRKPSQYTLTSIGLSFLEVLANNFTPPEVLILYSSCFCVYNDKV